MGINERKEREKLRRRNEIIDAARELFVNKGVDATSMDAIAKNAELSKGTLYLYFKSKEDIHYAIITRVLDVISELFDKHYLAEQKGIENLRSLGHAYVEFFENYPEDFDLITQFHSSNIEKVDETQRNKLLCADSPLIFVSKVIREGQNDGSIRNDMQGDEMTMILWSQITGVLEFVSFRKNVMELFGLNSHELIQNTFKLISDGLQK